MVTESVTPKKTLSEETKRKMADAAARRWTPGEKAKARERSRKFLEENPRVAEERSRFMREVVQPSSPASRRRVAH